MIVIILIRCLSLLTRHVLRNSKGSVIINTHSIELIVIKVVDIHVAKEYARVLLAFGIRYLFLKLVKDALLGMYLLSICARDVDIGEIIEVSIVLVSRKHVVNVFLLHEILLIQKLLCEIILSSYSCFNVFSLGFDSLSWIDDVVAQIAVRTFLSFLLALARVASRVDALALRLSQPSA